MATKKKRRPTRRVVKKKATRRPAAKKKTVRRKKATRRPAAKKTVRRKATRRPAAKKKAVRRRNPAAKKKKAASATALTPAQRRAAARAKAARKAKRTTAQRRASALKVNYSKRSPARAKKWKAYSAATRRAGKKPVWKSSVTMRAGYPMSKARRAKYIREGKLSSRGHANPPKRRKKARRKNPSIQSAFRQLGQANFWISGGQAVAGISAVVVLPSVIEQVAAKLGAGAYVRNSGGMGVALAAVSTALAMFGAQAFENMAIKRGIAPKAFNGLSTRVALGGVIVTVLKGLEVFARGFHSRLNLPTVPAPFIRVPGISAAPAPAPSNAVSDWVQLKGMGDWMQLQGMGLGGMSGMSGMSGVEMPDQLVLGESFARSVSQFDGIGDYRIPMNSIRGMGDYVGTAQQAGGALTMSAPQQNWEPSPLETF
jgi:hypothetical protein